LKEAGGDDGAGLLADRMFAAGPGRLVDLVGELPRIAFAEATDFLQKTFSATEIVR